MPPSRIAHILSQACYLNIAAFEDIYARVTALSQIRRIDLRMESLRKHDPRGYSVDTYQFLVRNKSGTVSLTLC